MKNKNLKQIKKLAQDGNTSQSLNLEAKNILTQLLQYQNDHNLLNILWLRNIYGYKIVKLFASCYNRYQLFTQTIYLLEKNMIDIMEQEANLELDYPIPFFLPNDKPLKYKPSTYQKIELRKSFETRLCEAVKNQKKKTLIYKKTFLCKTEGNKRN